MEEGLLSGKWAIAPDLETWAGARNWNRQQRLNGRHDGTTEYSCFVVRSRCDGV